LFCFAIQLVWECEELLAKPVADSWEGTMAPFRIATFNLENFDEDKPNAKESIPTLAERIAVMRPAMRRLNADLVCLQEVNGQERAGQPRALLALDKLLEGTQYAEFSRASTLTKSDNMPYDERNLVVLSRGPIVERQQIKDNNMCPAYRPVMPIPRPAEAKILEWERPILYVKTTFAAHTLHIINLHLKSKLPSTIQGQMDDYAWKNASAWAEGFFISSMKRVGQAVEARILVDKIFDDDPNAFIVVCGDLNSDSDDVPVTALRGPIEETCNPQLVNRVLVPCEKSIPESSRYSLLHLGKGNMLDHVLVSRSLLAYYRGSEIHNEVLPDESGAFRTDKLFPESDHAPIVAEFDLP
jgi:endonuclease/exonuclease/phosphatase family metal-dependent hydrolase